jgi:ribosome-binding factor A
MKQKDEKIKEVIRQLSAEFFSRMSNRTSLITITDVELKSRNSKATILFTVIPDNQEEAALDFMRRQLRELREYVGDHVKIMHVPFLDVAIDKGEKNRQQIDEISRNV